MALRAPRRLLLLVGLGELDLGHHPHFARIDGRLVEPIRAVYQTIREWRGRRQTYESAGFIAGKVIMVQRRKGGRRDAAPQHARSSVAGSLREQRQ